MDAVVRDQSHSNWREVLHFINYLFGIADQLFYFFKLFLNYFLCFYIILIY